jgi:hypothetical protein
MLLLIHLGLVLFAIWRHRSAVAALVASSASALSGLGGAGESRPFTCPLTP